MKFELNDFHRNVSVEELVTDLIKVAAKLKKDSVTFGEYDKHGKYSASTLNKKMGSWNKGLEMAGLKVIQRRDIPDSELIDDLKKVAADLKKDSVTFDEYDKHGKYSATTLNKKIGSWNKSLAMAGLKVIRRRDVPKEELFKNLEKVWEKLGRQPVYGEIQTPLSRFHNSTYGKRFGSWRKALEEFVVYINDPRTSDEETTSIEEAELKIQSQSPTKHKTSRTINWRLRWIVLNRDNFKCKNCGRSPATDPKIILHVDHIKAWANDGETVLENLQTLCSVCNIGKSNLE